MLIYNVGFINTSGNRDQTQLDIHEYNTEDVELIELMNLILSLKDEMCIKEVIYIDYVGCSEEDDE